MRENIDHSFNIYLKKKNIVGFDIKKLKDGISEGLFDIAQLLYGQRMHESSIAYSYLSLYLNSENYINYYLLAQNFQVLGKIDKAMKTLENIPLESYLGWNSFLKLADLNINIENYKAAEEYIAKLTEYEPNRIDTFYKLGEIYHTEKNYKKAVDSFSKGITLITKPQKKDWYLYYSRGMAYERSKKWENAEKDLLMALKLYPNQPLVLNYLGYSWIDFGINLEKAEVYIQKAIDIRPNDGYFVDSLGWAFYRKGEYEKAVVELEKAVELVPSDPIINDHLGDALYKAGYTNEAVYQWKRVLLYNPDDKLREIVKIKIQNGL